jgi:peptide-methionine (S)-S-oxide reductase
LAKIQEADAHGPARWPAIFWHDERQRVIADALIRELDAEKIWPAPIVTELRPATEFYKAEEYHQDYFRSHPRQPYCAYVVAESSEVPKQVCQKAAAGRMR